MNRIRQLAMTSPTAFGFVITLGFIVIVFISAVVANRWPAESSGWYVAATVARMVAIALLLAVVARLGWLRAAGFSQPGRGSTWLMTLLLLAYSIAASTYALTGHFNFNYAGAAQFSLVALFFIVHAFMEEVVFRGLILHAFVRASGSSLTRTIVISSLFFASMHFVNILGGNPLPVVLLQMVGAFFLGIFLSALVLNGRSIYPAAFFHGLANLAALLSLMANSSDGTNPSVWLRQSLFIVPLALIGIYILRRSTKPELALGAVS